MRQVLAAMSHDLVACGDRAWLQLHKRTWRLPPLVVRLGHNRGKQHGGMAMQHVLDLERRDVFAARDDDVLRPILHLDVAVGMHHGKVARVEPAATEGLFGCLGVLQVALHRDVSPEHHLTHRFAVGRCRRHRGGVHDGEAFLGEEPDTLAPQPF